MTDNNRPIDDFNETDLANMSADSADAALDAMIERFGHDYHRPPEFVPREEMWNEIRARSSANFNGRKRSPIMLLAAAAAILVAGISIGVALHSRVAPARPAIASASPPQNRNDAPATGAAPAPSQTVAAATESMPDRQQRGSGPVAHTGTTESGADNGANAASGDTRQSTAYSLATVRHLTAVEALLTTYQTAGSDSKADAQMANWSRALLSQTRLLLDSPAGRDPARRRLLEDLELVLVQMTQLAPGDTPIDREMIRGSVARTDVLTRIRAAVPAGATTTL